MIDLGDFPILLYFQLDGSPIRTVDLEVGFQPDRKCIDQSISECFPQSVLRSQIEAFPIV